MANLIESWSTTAASNTTVGGISIAEGTFARNLNDGIRAVMSDVASWRDATNGVKITTGAANAYVLSTGLSLAALAQKVRLTFEANHTNTGAATLNPDSLGATTIVRVDGSALTAGDITSGGIYDVAYEAGAAKFLLLNPTPTPTAAGVFTTIELGGATDTTLSRSGAGVLAVEGVNVLTTATGQGLDATLTALAAYSTNGLLTQTAADTFAGRTLTGTAAQITVTNGDGVSGNPTLSLPADVLIPTVLTVPNTGLHLLDTNASHDLIIKPGSDLTADKTLTVTTGDADRTLTIGADSSISGTAYVAGGTDVAIADGGTGQSTATLGFNALSPVTTRGDIIVRDATNNIRLALGLSRKVLVSDGTDLGYAYPVVGLNQQSGTTYTLALTDAFATVECSNAANVTVTVPANSSVAFPTGTVVKLRQTSFGGIIVAPGGGVTINSPLSKLALFYKYSEAWLEKVGTDTWQLEGRIVYSGTNLFTKTEQFDNAYWNKDGTTVTANDTTAPDGASTADKILETATTAVHVVNNFNVAKAASRIRYTWSCFFKGGLTRNYIKIVLYNSGFTASATAVFNISEGVPIYQSVWGFTAEFNAGLHYVEDYGSSWFRCCFPFSTDTDTSVYPYVYLMSAYNNDNYLGVITNGVYMWGAQLEAQPEAGIYKVVA